MKLNFTLITKRHKRAFTLLEILTVVAIIAILAGIMVPTVSRARVRARVAMTRLECANLASAIKTYQSEYSRFPTAYGQAANTPSGDLVFNVPFGMKHFSGDPMDTNPNAKQLVTPLNSDLVAILLAEDALSNKGHARNPKKRVFFEGKMSQDVQKPGVGPDGILRDVFGTPYIVTVDFNGDNYCEDALYGNTLNGLKTIRGQVLIWSLGPDMQMDSTPASTIEAVVSKKENNDNVLSWE